MSQWRSDCERMFYAALTACEPASLVEGYLSDLDISGFDKINLIGFGKASGRMALGAEAVLGSDIERSMVLSLEDREGLTMARAVPHPFPSEKTLELTKIVESIVMNTGSKDLLICLISGGGSAMLSHPTIPLDVYNETVSYLMNAGADILELNAFRRSVSNVKGGRLGASCKGTIINLIISDVINGGTWDIASGPTVTDESDLTSADIAEKYDLPANVIEALSDERLSFDSTTKILADNGTAVRAAYEEGKNLWLDAEVRKEPYTGEAGTVAKKLLSEAKTYGIYIAGGESIVNVKGGGTGGRNQHLCLSLHDERCMCFSAGTDGIDGNSAAAGAFLDDGSRAPDWKDYYERCDSAAFFSRSNSQLITGPTGTNVCDITMIKRD